MKYYSYIEKRPDTMGNLLLPDDAPQLDGKRREKTKLEERMVLGSRSYTMCVNERIHHEKLGPQSH